MVLRELFKPSDVTSSFSPLFLLSSYIPWTNSRVWFFYADANMVSWRKPGLQYLLVSDALDLICSVIFAAAA